MAKFYPKPRGAPVFECVTPLAAAENEEEARWARFPPAGGEASAAAAAFATNRLIGSPLR